MSLKYVGMPVNSVKYPQHAPKWPNTMAQTGGDFKISDQGSLSNWKLKEIGCDLLVTVIERSKLDWQIGLEI